LKTPQEWAELYEAAITAIVSGGVSSYSIAGRTFTKLDLPTLQRLYEYWGQRVEGERNGMVSIADMRC
jgi:hypothetical protein